MALRLEPLEPDFQGAGSTATRPLKSRPRPFRVHTARTDRAELKESQTPTDCDKLMFVFMGSGCATTNLDHSREVAEFMGSLRMLSDAGLKEQAIDLIFRRLDQYQDNGEFSICDEIIVEVINDNKKLMPTLLVSFLVITLAGRAHLRFRNALYVATESRFLAEDGEQRTRRILSGLNPPCNTRDSVSTRPETSSSQ
jgi:hypothetical protein